jgi:SsrA-binding protein
MAHKNIKNKKVNFEYIFIEEFTAGIQLLGSETRFVREGLANLIDSYCYIQRNEIFLKGLHIHQGTASHNHVPDRDKKLLLKKSEIKTLQKGLVKGTTIVPVDIIQINGRFKCRIALAKGKKEWDKRQTIKERDFKRELSRELKG